MSKTYGQVLLDEMYEGIHFERLSMVPEEEFDRCARAVILEFVRRVEERMGAIEGNAEMHLTIAETRSIALGKAFDQVSTELKEAK